MVAVASRGQCRQGILRYYRICLPRYQRKQDRFPGEKSGGRGQLGGKSRQLWTRATSKVQWIMHPATTRFSLRTRLAIALNCVTGYTHKRNFGESLEVPARSPRQ